jgi:hypothetical protein
MSMALEARVKELEAMIESYQKVIKCRDDEIASLKLGTPVSFFDISFIIYFSKQNWPSLHKRR